MSAPAIASPGSVQRCGGTKNLSCPNRNCATRLALWQQRSPDGSSDYLAFGFHPILFAESELTLGAAGGTKSARRFDAATSFQALREVLLF